MKKITEDENTKTKAISVHTVLPTTIISEFGAFGHEVLELTAIVSVSVKTFQRKFRKKNITPNLVPKNHIGLSLQNY